MFTNSRVLSLINTLAQNWGGRLSSALAKAGGGRRRNDL